MIMCQKASLVHFQIVRKGKFGPDSENMFQNISHTWLKLFKKACLVQIFLRIWTKLAFSNNLKVDQTCLLAHDHKFRREIKWTKFAFSKQVQHVILNSFKHFSGPKYKTLGTGRFWPSSRFQSHLVVETLNFEPFVIRVKDTDATIKRYFKRNHLLLPRIKFCLDQVQNWQTKNNIHFDRLINFCKIQTILYWLWRFWLFFVDWAWFNRVHQQVF